MNIVSDIKKSAKDWNVVLVFLDACGAKHMSVYGYSRQTTPNIERIAAEGVVFENAFSTNPSTIGSFGSIYSGLYVHRHNVRFPKHKLGKSIRQLGEVMKSAGFRTIGFCGNRLGGTPLGYAKGFDQFIEFQSMSELNKIPWIEKTEKRQDMILSWLEQNASNGKLFFWVHYVQPHAPYVTPAPFRGRFDKNLHGDKFYKGDDEKLLKAYRGEIEITDKDLQSLIDCYDENLMYADHLVGGLIAKLKEVGIFENTLFILASDHGEAFKEHGDLLHNLNVYEEMVHIPMIMRFPKGAVASSRNDALVETVDILPTLADIFELNEDLTDLDGKSLLPLVTGEVDKIKDYALSRTSFDHPTWGLRDKQYTYIYYTPCTPAPNWRPEKGIELYDRTLDPFEKKDIADEKKEKVQNMHKKLVELTGIDRISLL